METKLHISHYVFLVLLILLSLLALVGGFSLTGSPEQSRTINLDQKRVEHIADLSNTVEDYFQRNGELPQTLDQLTLYQEIVDPETKQPYEYRTISATDYELCAHFATDLSKVNSYMLPKEKKDQASQQNGCVPFSIPAYLVPTPQDTIMRFPQ